MGRTIANDQQAAKEATTGFKAYPAGDYIAEIIDVQESAVKTGANKGLATLSVQFRIVEPEEMAGKKFRDFGVPLFQKWSSGKAAFTHFQFFKNLSETPVDFSGETVELPDDEDLYEQTIGVRLKVEPKQDSDELQNRIGGYFNVSEGLKNPPKLDGEGGDEGDFAL